MTEINKSKTCKPRILLVTAAIGKKANSGILAYDYYSAFKSNGYEIDILTEYKAEIPENHLYLFQKNSVYFQIKRIKNKIKSITNRFFRIFSNEISSENYYFFYKYESKPPIKPKLITNKIKKKYDLVLLVFWNSFIGAKAIESIFNKLKCPIFFISVDDSTITGGCHYVNDCIGYQRMCENCPASNGEDFPNQNMKLRKEIWGKVKPEIFTNNYCKEYYKKSTLFKNRNINILYPVVNENLFTPTSNQSTLRRKYGIDNNTFVMFFGAANVNEPRKGISYLYDALRKFYNIDNISTSNILILIAGNNDQIQDDKICFPYKKLGVLNMYELADVFALSDLYLSPSIMDAGPMMVNQSLSCGTPVVSFDIGVASDLIKDRGTGYCAKLKDSDDFAKGIKTIFDLDEIEKKIMNDSCRNIALETTSYNAIIDKIMKVYGSI